MAEKSIEQINRRARELYERALGALERKNYDYAISLLSNALALEPAFLKAHRMLHATQVKRFQQAGNPILKKILVMLRFTPLLLIRQSQFKQKPAAAITLAQKVLCEDPTNTLALHMLADASRVSNDIDTGVLAMEWLVENHPKNTKILHKMAEFYMAADQPDKARDVYERILDINPQDGVAAMGLRNATAALSMKEGRWDHAQSYREVLKDKAEAITLEQESRMVLDSEILEKQIREHEEKLAQEPNNLALLRIIGDLYFRKADFDRAVSYFESALALSGGGDPTLETKITEAVSLKYDRQIEALQAQLNANPAAPELASQIQSLKQQKRDYLIARAEHLANRYPTESQYHYDLGLLYYENGRYDEAVRELQLAQRHPQYRIATMNYLGLCYMAKGVLDIARDVFMRADAEHKFMDSLKKEIIYNLGVAFERAGEHAKAYEQFKRIYEVDIGFRDVAARVEAGSRR